MRHRPLLSLNTIIKEIIKMSSQGNLERFISSLQEQHYSVAFIRHLVDTITNNTRNFQLT